MSQHAATHLLNVFAAGELADASVVSILEHTTGDARPWGTVAKSASVQTEGELLRSSVVAEFATTAADGKTYQVEFYNLEVIIAQTRRLKTRQGRQSMNSHQLKTGGLCVSQPVTSCHRLKMPPNPRNLIPLP